MIEVEVTSGMPMHVHGAQSMDTVQPNESLKLKLRYWYSGKVFLRTLAHLLSGVAIPRGRVGEVPPPLTVRTQFPSQFLNKLIDTFVK